MRQLAWQRKHNTRPRYLGEAIEDLQQLMQQLGQADPAAMDEMMIMMQSPELQQMGEQMAAAMAAHTLP